MHGQVDEGVFLNALIELVKLDSQWVPDGEGSFLLYPSLHVCFRGTCRCQPSAEYRFIIFTCPVGPYYKGNVRVKVETFFTRAAPGGTGYAKAAGNYAASLKPTAMAHVKAMTRSCGQMLWSTNTLRRAVP